MRAHDLDEWSESMEAATSRLLGELEMAASRVLHDLEAAAARLLRDLEAAASRLLREQADRLLAALPTAELVLSGRGATGLVAPWIEAAQPAALEYDLPRPAAWEVMAPALVGDRTTLSAGVHRAPSGLDARRAEVAASATASSHDAGEAETLRPPASGDASAPPRPVRHGGGPYRADGHGRRKALKKVNREHRRQPGRATGLPGPDGAIHPPAVNPGDRPMSAPGTVGEHDADVLVEAA